MRNTPRDSVPGSGDFELALLPPQSGARRPPAGEIRGDIWGAACAARTIYVYVDTVMRGD